MNASVIDWYQTNRDRLTFMLKIATQQLINNSKVI